jgi:Gpi18-like mannosyltransferase
MRWPFQGRVSAQLLVLIGAGVLLKFLLAYVLLYGAGSSADVYAYAGWTLRLTEVGPKGFYQSTGSDYPPGYLFVLWILGKVDLAVASLANADFRAVIITSIKIPPVLIDAVCGLMVFHIIRRWLVDEADSEKTALAAAGIYTFNPVLCYDSAIWGQTDSVGIFVMLATLLSLMRGPPEVAAAVAVLAGLLKPQFGFVAAPLVGIVLLKRYLSPTARSHWIRKDGSIRLVSSVVVAIVVLHVVIAPFGLTAKSFFARMAVTAGGYPFLALRYTLDSARWSLPMCLFLYIANARPRAVCITRLRVLLVTGSD